MDNNDPLGDEEAIRRVLIRYCHLVDARDGSTDHARLIAVLERLAVDPRLPLDRPALDAALADKQAFIGAAGDQVDAVVAAVDALVVRYPDAAKYTPGAIL